MSTQVEIDPVCLLCILYSVQHQFRAWTTRPHINKKWGSALAQVEPKVLAVVLLCFQWSKDFTVEYHTWQNSQISEASATELWYVASILTRSDSLHRVSNGKWQKIYSINGNNCYLNLLILDACVCVIYFCVWWCIRLYLFHKNSSCSISLICWT